MISQKQNRTTDVWSSSAEGKRATGEITKALMIVVLLFAMISCHRKPFVRHKLKFEKISDNCENLKPSFRMVSNVAGERYEFESCLAANFTKDDADIFRKGDTVVMLLSKPANQKALFKLTVDIDSYPRYNFIKVDGETFNVIPSNY